MLFEFPLYSIAFTRIKMVDAGPNHRMDLDLSKEDPQGER